MHIPSKICLYYISIKLISLDIVRNIVVPLERYTYVEFGARQKVNNRIRNLGPYQRVQSTLIIGKRRLISVRVLRLSSES